MVVHHTEDVVEAVQVVAPLLQRSDVVAYMKFSGWLDSAEDTWFRRHRTMQNCTVTERRAWGKTGSQQKSVQNRLLFWTLVYSPYGELLLSRFESWVGLADYVYSTFASDYLAIWMSLLSGAEAGEYLHRFIRRRVYQ